MWRSRTGEVCPDSPAVGNEDAVAAFGALQRYIKSHCPWTNGEVERFDRTLQTEWAYRQPFTSKAARSAALAPWLNHYNHDRIHGGTGTTPAVRASRT